MSEEDIEFADMIVGDFEDTYDNLPLKTFLGYQFYHDFCQNSKYVAFIDDDTIVRFDEFESIFIDPIEDEMICLRGHPIQHDNPTYHGKYHIWYDQWPNVYNMPSYCNGQCMATTKQNAAAIYNTASFTDLNEFRIEDIYYTGIMRKKAGLPEPKSITVQGFKKILHERVIKSLKYSYENLREFQPFLIFRFIFAIIGIFDLIA